MSGNENPRWLIDQEKTMDLNSQNRQYYLYNQEIDKSFLIRGYGSEDDPIVIENLIAGDKASDVYEPMRNLAERRGDDVFFAWEGEPYVVTQAGRSMRLYLDERQRDSWRALLENSTIK